MSQGDRCNPANSDRPLRDSLAQPQSCRAWRTGEAADEKHETESRLWIQGYSGLGSDKGDTTWAEPADCDAASGESGEPISVARSHDQVFLSRMSSRSHLPSMACGVICLFEAPDLTIPHNLDCRLPSEGGAGGEPLQRRSDLQAYTHEDGNSPKRLESPLSFRASSIVLEVRT